MRTSSQPAVGGLTRTHGEHPGPWEHVARRPPAHLRPYVASASGYDHRLAAPAVHRTVPTPHLPLVITFGPRHHVIGDGARAPIDSFVAGLYDRFVLLEADRFHGIQLNLTPFGAYRLLGMPLRLLRHQIVPLDAVVLRRVAEGPRPSPEVQRALSLVHETQGAVRVADVAAEIGWSRRHLAARFDEQVGMPPKQLARLVRFDRATRLLSDPDGPELSQVAIAAGFYDQAHLTNEVRAFCGLTPAQLVARRRVETGGLFDAT